MTERHKPEWAKAPLLPYCSSDLERDLDIALSHIETVKIPIRDLWNPDKCPLVALPYLAWAVKVQYWDSKWNERTKRRVVASSLDVHRVRGTRPAVEKALESLGADCEITEWFQDPTGQMQRGTFAVKVKVKEGVSETPDPNFANQLREVVTEAKPASRPFSLTMSVGVGTEMAIAGVLRLVRKVPLTMEMDAGWTPPTGRLFSEIGIASALRLTQTFEIKMETT
ncbi:MAG: phage tail protein I [Aeromonadaceae bacterium]